MLAAAGPQALCILFFTWAFTATKDFKLYIQLGFLALTGLLLGCAWDPSDDCDPFDDCAQNERELVAYTPT